MAETLSRMGVELDLKAIPANDKARLKKLQSYHILDSPPEASFDNIATIAAKKFNTPIALVSLVDKYRVWYKSTFGMDDLSEVPRNDSLCSLVVLQDEITVITNALEEPCLLINPFVAGEFGLRFYAGAPIKTDDGFRLGAVCVIDQHPRKFSPADQIALEDLAAMAMWHIKKRLCR